MEEPLHFKNFPLNNEALQIYLLEFLFFFSEKNPKTEPQHWQRIWMFQSLGESHNPKFQWASLFFPGKKTENWFVEFTISPLPRLIEEILRLLPVKTQTRESSYWGSLSHYLNALYIQTVVGVMGFHQQQ